jgi:hypothetical protein
MGDDALLATQVDDAERFRNCDRIHVACPVCSAETVFGGVFTLGDDKASDPATADQTLRSGSGDACGLYCPAPKCSGEYSLEHISSRVELGIRAHIKTYLDGWMLCDDNTCGHRTRQLSVRGDHCLSMRCRGRVSLEYSEKRLFEQLKYYESLFDVDRAMKMLNQQNKKREETGQAVRRGATVPSKLLPVYARLKEHVGAKIKEESEYNWVDSSFWGGVFGH